MRPFLAWPKAAALVLTLGLTGGLQTPGHTRTLNLDGYIDPSGAISVQHRGDTVDPYFALQALLLAHDHGLDTAANAQAWWRWLGVRYAQTGRLDRHCRQSFGWQPCRRADADDASLALWLGFLRTLPPQGSEAHDQAVLAHRAQQALHALLDKRTGLYRVSAEVPHHLFMDNLEVWSVLRSPQLARRIQSTFRDHRRGLYRVSTQSEHPHPGNTFYPDATAQIYPLLVGFPGTGLQAENHYHAWMVRHRADWLRQMDSDFAWGLIALLAWQQKDALTVRCWQTRALPLRHSRHWTVTDEVVFQILPPLHLLQSSVENCS